MDTTLSSGCESLWSRLVVLVGATALAKLQLLCAIRRRLRQGSSQAAQMCYANLFIAQTVDNLGIYSASFIYNVRHTCDCPFRRLEYASSIDLQKAALHSSLRSRCILYTG